MKHEVSHVVGSCEIGSCSCDRYVRNRKLFMWLVHAEQEVVHAISPCGAGSGSVDRFMLYRKFAAWYVRVK